MKLTSNLTVAVLPAPQFVEILPNGDLDGTEGTFLKVVLTALGINYRLVIPEDLEFGRLINGSWTGLVGMVHKGQADLACAAIGITTQRKEYVDFSTAYQQSSLTFAIGRATSMRANDAYLRPFPLTLWMCFLGCLILMSLTLSFVFKRRYSYARIALEFMAHTLGQPFAVRDGNLLSVKIQLVLWSFFSIVLSTCYRGKLLSFMTVPEQGKTIQTFGELSDAVKRGTHRCFTMEGSGMVSILRATNKQHLQDLGEAITRNNWYFSRESTSFHARELIAPNTALITSQWYLERVLDRSNPDIFISKDFLSTVSTAMVLSRHFCCKKKLNRIISRLQSAGIIEHINENLIFKYQLSSPKNFRRVNQITALSVDDISGIFLFLTVGLSIAIFILLVEKVLFSVTKIRSIFQGGNVLNYEIRNEIRDQHMEIT